LARALAWHARGRRFDPDTLHKAHISEPFYFMPFYIYIIYSAILDKYYVGYTENIAIRLLQHNEGLSTFTSKANDWILKYAAEFSSREEAHKKELEIKRKKSRKYIEWLISSVG
jgi:putative endonuclease